MASLGHPCKFHKFQRVSRVGSVTERHCSSGRQPSFAALNRRCHLYSAGRPSRWALDHILVCDMISLSVFGQPLPPDHCPVCLSVTVVYWGPTVGWIKMNQLGMEVGHGPSHIVLNGDPAPNFWPMSVVAKRLDKSRCHWYGGRPRPRQQCVRWITLN